MQLLITKKHTPGYFLPARCSCQWFYCLLSEHSRYLCCRYHYWQVPRFAYQASSCRHKDCFRYWQELQINAICHALGLPICHCWSIFGGKGRRKKSSWEAWISFPEVTQAYMSTRLHTLLTNILNIEIKTKQLESVARRELFSQKKKSMENIPPTLLQNFKYLDLNILPV